MQYTELPNLHDLIPIHFEWQGRFYSGAFKMPKGIGGQSWFLMINDFYFGTLVHQGQEWVFHSQYGIFDDLAEWFGSVIMAWYG